jgi:hypothetical protein
MFGWIIGGWAVGMVCYVALNKADRYNNLHYFNLSNKYKKYKKMKARLDDKNTGLF